MVAMFCGAMLGAVLVLHACLVWPLVIACGGAAIATATHALRPLPAAIPADAGAGTKL
ncbi:MAG: hypothetical protein ACHQNA_01920 [Acidimicrobiales bacterium]